MKDNFFTYSNLQGQFPEIENDIRLGTPTAVFGVSDSQKYLIASLTQGGMLYIAPDSISAQKAYAVISVLSGKSCACLTAKDEVLLYKDAISKDALFRRLTAVHAILTGCRFIVCDVEAALQQLPKKLPSITFTVGGEYDYQSLPSKLVQMGYTREYAADNRGSFAVRGDILDIFPVGEDNPVRIDFFGDTVEKIKPYDAVSGERLPEKNTVTIISATDCFVSENEKGALKKLLASSM